MRDFSDDGRLYTFTILYTSSYMAKNLKLSKLLSGQAERPVSAEGIDHKVHITYIP